LSSRMRSVAPSTSPPRVFCSARAAPRTLWGLALILLSACEIEKVAIPRTEPRVAMHAVLSASSQTQVVLLERTRAGLVFPVAPFDIPDPTISDEGIPESGAIVRLTTPSGQTLFAPEEISIFNQKGGGIYRFALPGDALERSGTYSLSVQTSKGEILTAETSVPEGVAVAFPEQRLFDRARDTVDLEWPASPGARSYFVRIETPYGPRSFFTDSTRVRLTGELRNVELKPLPRVFIPGFPQAVTVSAVDSNYYDWFRTHNNALSGTGLVNRVSGGLGVFGSLVRLKFQDLRVVAPQPEPAAGMFVFVGTPIERSTTPYLSLELYVESRSARSDQPDALSGRYDRRTFLGMTGCVTCGMFGTTRNGRIELAFLRDWFARDTAEILTGEIRGDTIVGRYRGFGGLVHFVKQP
jgi:hypothetical protein